ncbi:MAG: SDR family NAD(P)-dependent oxidoreductase [Chitinophagaceae bacterium]
MKTIIITGSNGNLGTACVKKFLDTGYRVIAVGGRDDQPGFGTGNPQYAFSKVDLSDESETGIFISDCIKKYGTIDAALLLVGGFTAGNMAAATGTIVQQMFSLNFETAYFMARPLLQHMQDYNYGRLVFIGARPALVAAQGKDLMAYALSKSLLFKLAEFMNEACKGTNITATVIVPGTIDTPLNRKSMPDTNPANWVTPAAIAETIAFAVSDNANALREPVLKLYNNA